MSNKSLIELAQAIQVMRGAPGSGNWGHTGRPGKRGGSSGGGGHARIGVKQGDSPRRIRQKAKAHKEGTKQARQGEKLFSKVKHGGQLTLTDGDLDVDVSIETFGGAYGMAVKRPSDKGFGKHHLRSSHYIKQYLGQFRERKGETTKADLTTKIGARHTSQEFDLIQKMHDLARNLGATCHPAKEEKAGAKHSQADTAMIQRIHDDCVKLGAACPVDKTRLPLPVPGMRDLMHKAQADAPNYRPASTPRRCENCIYFRDDPGGDYCERFDFVADRDYVCDDWQAQNPDEIPGYRQNGAMSLAQVMRGVMELRGGPGSGNWGHAGRPGKRGGSGGGGGLARIGAKPGSSHEDRKKASAKHRQSGKKKGGDSKKQGDSKLNKIFEGAPKNEGLFGFNSYLLEKMQSGEINNDEAIELSNRFAGKPKSKNFDPAEFSGDVKRGRVYEGQELQQGAATKQYDKWADGLSDKQRNALIYYQSEPFDDQPTDYHRINQHLRGSDDNPTKATRDAITQMDRALAKSRVPEDTVAYRGFPAFVLGDNPQSLIGKTIQDKGFTSTSLSHRVSSDFLGSTGIMAEIRIPKGARGGLLDSLRSGKDPEHELLLPRDSSFRILGVGKVGNTTQVVMELVQ